MERVSFEVAKALKEAGYPQNREDTVYLNNGETYTFDDANPLFKYVPNTCCDAPYAMEVWLWMWRSKNIVIEPTHCKEGWTVPIFRVGFYCDPEEAIIAAIEFLCENNLIK